MTLNKSLDDVYNKRVEIKEVDRVDTRKRKNYTRHEIRSVWLSAYCSAIGCNKSKAHCNEIADLAVMDYKQRFEDD